jgi:hypothetical protein
MANMQRKEELMQGFRDKVWNPDLMQTSEDQDDIRLPLEIAANASEICDFYEKLPDNIHRERFLAHIRGVCWKSDSVSLMHWSD